MNCMLEKLLRSFKLLSFSLRLALIPPRDRRLVWKVLELASTVFRLCLMDDLLRCRGTVYLLTMGLAFPAMLVSFMFEPAAPNNFAPDLSVRRPPVSKSGSFGMDFLTCSSRISSMRFSFLMSIFAFVFLASSDLTEFIYGTMTASSLAGDLNGVDTVMLSYGLWSPEGFLFWI